MQKQQLHSFAALLILIIGCFSLSNAQNVNSSDPLTISFVKKEIIQENGELSFNVAQVQNNTSDSLTLRPIIELPQGWAIFSISLTDTIIPPGGNFSFPFRFRPSQQSRSNIEHQVIFKVFIKDLNMLTQSNFIVRLKALHNWNIIIPNKRVFFYPEAENAPFEIIIENNGNTAEEINLEMSIDRNIQLIGISGNSYNTIVRINSNRDTTLRFSAVYNGTKDRVFDLNKVQIIAKTTDKKIYRAVIIEKYSDIYAPFEVDRTLSHESEIGIRSFSKSNSTLPFVRARGNHKFKNESSFRYNFTYYDITGYENIISNSYYNFLYSWESFNAGLGAFSSTLGRNMYNRNCIMVSNEFNIDDNSSIEGFASYGLTSPKANLAAAYSYKTDKLKVKGSVAYDIDSYHNRNTASAIINTGRIPIFRNHDIRLSLYGYQEDYKVKNEYTQTGYAWDFNYYGKISDGFSIHFTNNYGSPDIPGPQMGLLNFYTKLKFSPNDAAKNYVSLTYVNSSRDYYYVDREGIRLPTIYLKDQYASLLFHNNSHKKARWYIGPSIEFFNSSHPIPQTGKRSYYDVDKYRMEFKGYFGSNFNINIKYGLGIMVYEEENLRNENQHDFHVLADYNNNGYGLRLSYDYGPMVNMGLYQYAMDAGNNSISVSPYMLKTFFSGRVAVSLFTNYTYRFDLKYGSLNINPKVETYVFKDWYAVVGGTYNHTRQSYAEFDSKSSFHYLEFSIKKKWGRSDYYKWRKDLRRLKIQLFKDGNGNGKKDRGEGGIANVKVRIQLVNTADADARDNFPVDITLMSNDKGIVTFTRIPKGFYKVTIVPTTDLKEYFYVNNTTDIIELNRNQVVNIPFQKANKIIGKVELKRHRFITEKDERIGLSNIKITAYNNKGDSYSTFTRSDGSFTVFAPGNHVYYVRMKNVFGNEFTILNNDARRALDDSVSVPIVIRVVEKSRKVKFKKAGKKSKDGPDLQKIKVLPGKIYKNSSEEKVDIRSLPDFDMSVAEEQVVGMEAGKFYICAGVYNSYIDARKTMDILKEQGLTSRIGATEDNSTYYVIVDSGNSRKEINEKLKNFTRVGIKPVEIIHFKQKDNN